MGSYKMHHWLLHKHFTWLQYRGQLWTNPLFKAEIVSGRVLVRTPVSAAFQWWRMRPQSAGTATPWNSVHCRLRWVQESMKSCYQLASCNARYQSGTWWSGLQSAINVSISIIRISTEISQPSQNQQDCLGTLHQFLFYCALCPLKRLDKKLKQDMNNDSLPEWSLPSLDLIQCTWQ